MDVGNKIKLRQETWSFADAIEHFDEHILQSIPNCQEQREYVASLARFFMHTGSLAYEIGVSTGGLARAVLERTQERQLRYIGLDIEPDMLQLARHNLSNDPRFTAIQSNAVDYNFEEHALCISYYTLQFIPLKQRQILMARIYQALAPGGAFIIYEKTMGEDARVQDMLTQLYFDFKADQGLSAQAILNKAVALRGVSMPLSLEDNRKLLQQAGFKTVEIIYRAYAFAGYMALKD